MKSDMVGMMGDLGDCCCVIPESIDAALGIICEEDDDGDIVSNKTLLDSLYVVALRCVIPNDWS